MMLNNLKVGQFVRSKSGRDKNHIFIVVKVIDFEYVLIADGDIRRIDKPKKKKIKHLFEYDKISDNISDADLKNIKITNLMIRKEIEKFDLDNINLGGF